MKSNFVVSLFGSLVGFGMLLILLSAAGVVGARGADVRSDVARNNAVSTSAPQQHVDHEANDVESVDVAHSTTEERND